VKGVEIFLLQQELQSRGGLSTIFSHFWKLKPLITSYMSEWGILVNDIESDGHDLYM
jgi:hypothetical protein